ncbi:helicase C-terminal domain-containing protein [Noviherbaspirillum album]|uniref:helicase C-terminal domain-containing protein n=1 Tax=Noviherbaspirillum album TaxID=3080276 RepID=UPI00346052DC
MQLSVPDAARKLEQRVGRLIRTESDNGRVVVLDTRLWTTRFGRLILRGLPPFRIMAMGKEVIA